MYYYKMSIKLGQQVNINFGVGQMKTIGVDYLFDIATDADKRNFLEKQVKKYVAQTLLHGDGTNIPYNTLNIKRMNVHRGNVNVFVDDNFPVEPEGAASGGHAGGARSSSRRRTSRRRSRRRNTRRRSKKQ